MPRWETSLRRPVKNRVHQPSNWQKIKAAKQLLRIPAARQSQLGTKTSTTTPAGRCFILCSCLSQWFLRLVPMPFLSLLRKAKRSGYEASGSFCLLVAAVLIWEITARQNALILQTLSLSVYWVWWHMSEVELMILSYRYSNHFMLSCSTREPHRGTPFLSLTDRFSLCVRSILQIGNFLVLILFWLLNLYNFWKILLVKIFVEHVKLFQCLCSVNLLLSINRAHNQNIGSVAFVVVVHNLVSFGFCCSQWQRHCSTSGSIDSGGLYGTPATRGDSYFSNWQGK